MKKIITLAVFIVAAVIGYSVYNSLYKEENGWNRYFQRIDKPISNKLLVNYINRNHEDTKQLTVLDLGAGNGGDTVFLLEKGYKVVAVDFHEESIKRIKKNVDPHYFDNLTLIQSRFEDIDWNTLPQFDLIIAFRSIPFVERKNFDTLWNNIYAGLKDKGVLIAKLFGDKMTLVNNSKTTFNQQTIDQLLKKYSSLYVKELYQENKKTLHEFDLILQK